MRAFLSEKTRFEKTVLIVDDNPILVELFDEILGRLFTTTTACNIADAINLITNTTVDALVCDYHLGAERADRLIAWIASNAPELMPKVVMISGDDHLKFKHCEKVASVMLKPVDYDELTENISSLFAQG